MNCIYLLPAVVRSCVPGWYNVCIDTRVWAVPSFVTSCCLPFVTLAVIFLISFPLLSFICRILPSSLDVVVLSPVLVAVSCSPYFLPFLVYTAVLIVAL